MRNLLLSRMEKMKTMMSWGNKDNDVWTKMFLLVAIDSLRSFFFFSRFNFLSFACAYILHYNDFPFPSTRCFHVIFLAFLRGVSASGEHFILFFFIIIFFCTLFVVIIFGKRDESPKEWCKKHDRKQLRQKAPS